MPDCTICNDKKEIEDPTGAWKSRAEKAQAGTDKTHKVSKRVFDSANSFRKVNSFVNPGVHEMPTVCGTEPFSISYDWKRVTCKKCLKRKPAAEREEKG